MVACMLPVASEAYTPIASCPCSPRLLDLNLRKAASASSMIRRAASKNSWPAIVGRVPPLVRSNNMAPKTYSRARSRRLSVDCLTLRVSAACRKLRCRDATSAHRRSRSSTVIGWYLSKFGPTSRRSRVSSSCLTKSLSPCLQIANRSPRQGAVSHLPHSAGEVASSRNVTDAALCCGSRQPLTIA